METYKEFLDRINSFEKSEIDLGNGYFKGNPSITLAWNFVILSEIISGIV